MDRTPDRDSREGLRTGTGLAAGDRDMDDPFARTRFRVVRDEKRASRGVRREGREGGA